MRKFTLAIAALALAGFVSGTAQAQSAKFAATWADDLLMITINSTVGNCVFAGAFDGGSTGGGGTEASPCIGAKTEIAEIHVAQQKDLLIGVSGQIGIITITQAKGKKGSDATATASGEIAMTVTLKDQVTEEVFATAPGPVVFAARFQELTVSVGGTSTEDIHVLVALTLKTTAAHHFNFLGVDLPQGTYDVIATFDLSAFAEANGFDADTFAEAKLTLGPRVVSAQEVRAVKNSIVDPN